MYHVYQIIDRSEKRVLYVGCTTNTSKRQAQHWNIRNLGTDQEFRIVLSTPVMELAAQIELEMIRETKAIGQAEFNKSERRYLPAPRQIVVVYRTYNPNHTFNGMVDIARFFDCGKSTVRAAFHRSNKVRIWSHKLNKMVCAERITKHKQPTSAR